MSVIHIINVMCDQIISLCTLFKNNIVLHINHGVIVLQVCRSFVSKLNTYVWVVYGKDVVKNEPKR